MGYTVDLAYPIKSRSKYLKYDIARVRPFKAGGTLSVDYESLVAHAELATDLVPADPTEDGYKTQTRSLIERLIESGEIDLSSLQPVDDSGLTDATLDVTGNYSLRIREVMGMGLRDLYGQTAAEAVGNLAVLVSNLANEEPDADYWKPTDGNIRVLGCTLMDWSFQHPHARFYTHG